MVKKGQLEVSKADSDEQGEDRDPNAPHVKHEGVPEHKTSGHGQKHGGSMGSGKGK